MKSREYWKGWRDAIAAVNEQAGPGMAETVREARENAWDEGAQAAGGALGRMFRNEGAYIEPTNPYRPTGEVA